MGKQISMHIPAPARRATLELCAGTCSFTKVARTLGYSRNVTIDSETSAATMRAACR